MCMEGEVNEFREGSVREGVGGVGVPPRWHDIPGPRIGAGMNINNNSHFLTKQLSWIVFFDQ